MSYNPSTDDPFENDYQEPISRQTQMKPFPQSEGEHDLGKVVVKSVETVTFKTGNTSDKVTLDGWIGNFLADVGKFKVGQVVDSFKVRAKASNNASFPFNYSAVSPRQQGGSFPGQGGGRSNWQPKSPEEFHAPSIGGIIKSCIESGQDEVQAKAWIGIYLDACKSAGK